MSKSFFFMAFSPDGIAVVVNLAHGRFLALIEIKSRVTDNTVEEETTIQNSYGHFISLQIGSQHTEPSFFMEWCVESYIMLFMWSRR